MSNISDKVSEIAVKAAEVAGGLAFVASNIVSPSPALPDRCLPNEPTPVERTYEAASSAYEQMRRDDDDD